MTWAGQRRVRALEPIGTGTPQPDVQGVRAHTVPMMRLFSSSSLRRVVALGLILAPLPLTGCKKDPCSTQCQCKTLGNCARSGSKCIPKKAEHCAASNTCKVFGACSLVDERCVPRSDADCAQSQGCKLGKLCKFDVDRCVK